jgi:ABC-type dipeptide/oligopeptide/nickel transport system permease component
MITLDKRMEYCIWLGFFYAEIAFILTIGFGIPFMPEHTEWWSFFIPTTIPQVIAIPFYIVGILVILDILPVDGKNSEGAGT